MKLKDDYLITLGLLLYTLSRFLERVKLPISNAFWNPMILLACVILLFNSLITNPKVKVRAFVLFALLILCLFIDSAPTGAHELIYLSVVLWAVKKSNIDIQLKHLYILTGVLTLLVVLLAVVGVLPNNVAYVGQRERYSVGFYGYDVLPLQYLSLVFGFSLLYKKKPNVLIAIIFESVGFIVYRVTRVRTVMYLLTMFLLVWFFLSYKPIKNWRRTRILILVPSLCVGFSFLLDFLFKIKNQFIWMINGLLLFRISMQNYMIDKYGISLLGSSVPWDAENKSQYMYVDNAYINLLLTWGIIGLIFVLLLYSYVIYYSIKSKNTVLLLVSVSVSLLGLLWNVMTIFPYVEFILYFSTIFNEKIRIKNIHKQMQITSE